MDVPVDPFRWPFLGLEEGGGCCTGEEERLEDDEEDSEDGEEDFRRGLFPLDVSLSTAVSSS